MFEIFLLRRKNSLSILDTISLIQSLRFPSDKGEFESFVTVLCFSMMLILIFAPLTCSLVLKR